MMLDDIQAFCAVAEFKNLTQAAAALKISTPMMTRRIQRLETALGQVLFHRTTRLVALTEAGQAFHAHAEAMLLEYSHGQKAMQNLSTHVSGALKIGVPMSISHLWLTPNLHKFYQQYPDISVTVVNGNHLLDLLSQGFDLVVHCGPLADIHGYAHKVRDWYKVTCASKAYIKKFGEPAHPYDLRDHHCLDHYYSFNQCWHYQINKKHEEVFINSMMKADTSLDIKNLAVSGLGVAFLPDFTVQQALNAGKLQAILTDYQPAAIPMYLVYSSRRKNSGKLKAIIDFLSDLLVAY